eukprot:12371040-Prorocentrum_lima.AAC.1
MTSSLVGSEMCIRDRYFGRVKTFPLDLVNGRRLALSFKSGDTCELLMDPVSYTHLTLPTICSV